MTRRQWLKSAGLIAAAALGAATYPLSIVAAWWLL